VDGLVLEFLREVDDLDRVEGTLLDADATGLAQTDLLGDVDLFGLAFGGLLAARRVIHSFPVRFGGQ